MKLKPTNKSLLAGVTIHPKYVFPPVSGRILKPATNNNKLSKGSSNVIRKGHWRGMPMFSLTLEERKTCPPFCHHYDDCFGNNMGFAHRYEHGEKLEHILQTDIAFLAHMFPHGFVVRLHILGDFYSAKYVELWESMLAKYPMLHVFGYSARHKAESDGINAALLRVRYEFPMRWYIRFSTNQAYDDDGIIYAAEESFKGDAIGCPEQLGKTESCLSCGLCWSINKTIKFYTH